MSKKLVIVIGPLVVLLLLTSCATPRRISVVDSAGQPIEGAEVRVQARSFDHEILTTGTGGSVRVRPSSWDCSILVSKRGYKAESLNIPNPWPASGRLVVTLHEDRR